MARRSLILITIDCLRADHVGFLGCSRETTPFLDSLANESFIFNNALANGVPTYYSLPALLNSRYPMALGRDIVGMAPGESTIASELKECGYRTAAFVAANPYISPFFGYADGFDVFCDFLHSTENNFAINTGEAQHSFRGSANSFLSRTSHGLPLLGSAYDELYFRYCQLVSSADSLDSLRRFPSADVIVDSAIAWLNEHSPSPFFLWLHFMDPHAPYYPKPDALALVGHRKISSAGARYLNCYWARGDLAPKRLVKKRESIFGLYDAGIRWADTQIARLASKLVDLNVWNNCAVAVTADHGEEFLEHGGRFHAPFKLNEELVHVPLLLRVPGAEVRREVLEPFGLIDLAPTMLDALGLSPPADFRGRSCWRKLLKKETWSHPVVTECAYGCTNPFDEEKRNAPRLLAVRKGDYKLILNFVSGSQELFQLTSDPNETCPLPLGTAMQVRRELLEHAKKHVAESYKSRDLDSRVAAKVKDLRLKWAHSNDIRSN